MSKVIGKARGIWRCAICGELHTGWGNNPAPIMDYNSALVCSECNGLVVAFRFLNIQMGDSKYKTIDREQYKKIKRFARKHKDIEPLVEFLDMYFKGTEIDKITDPIDYGDLVEMSELDTDGKEIAS